MLHDLGPPLLMARTVRTPDPAASPSDPEMSDEQARHSDLPPLVVVDGMNLLWRAAFGFPARIRDGQGEDVTPAFGFFALLRKAIHGLSPCEAVVVFDGEGSSDARVEMAPDYKANRADADYSHLAWLPTLYEGLRTIGLQFEETTGAEADDVIAELVRRVGAGRFRVIVSADRDFYQLIGDHVVIANTMRKSGEQIVDGDEVRSRFGVEPWQWCDYMALVGDTSDNIPGVRGIGPKRAAAALAGGHTLEKLNGVAHQAWWGRYLNGHIPEALKARELIRFAPDVQTSIQISVRASQPLPLAADLLKTIGVW